MFIRLWLHKKNHYRLIAVDLSRQKELDADSKAIQQIELVECWWNTMYACFNYLGKITETRLKFSEGSVTVI